MISKLNRFAPLGIICFWALLTFIAYFAFNEFFKPVPQMITSSGDLVITRSRDGHFYADGAIDGLPVRFLLDTGASLVVVTGPFAKSVGLRGLDGAVNGAGAAVQGALLGQNFLSKFDVTMGKYGDLPICVAVCSCRNGLMQSALPALQS